MKALIRKGLEFAAGRLPGTLALFIAILVFLIASKFVIIEKGLFAKLLPTGAGLITGFVGGGILGWLVGGIGVVAMGTGIGIGALGAIFVGAIAGAVLGGLSGAAFSFLRLLLSPSDFNVHWLGLLAVFLASVGVFFVVRFLLQKLSAVARSIWNLRSNTKMAK